MNDEKEKRGNENNETLSEIFLNFMKKQKEKTKVEEVKETKKIIEIKKEDFTLLKSHEKLFMMLATVVNVVNERIEKILYSDRQAKWLSLLLTIIVFFVVNGGSLTNSFLSNTYANVFEDIPVKVENLPDEYEVSGLPATVDITVTGSSYDLTNLKLTNSIRAYVDLSNYSEGTHTVNIQVGGIPESLNVNVYLNPNSAEIKIMPKVTETHALTYEYIHLDEMDSMYVLDNPELAFNEVTIYASQTTLDKISKVVAQIDVSNVRESFEKEAKIVAYDYNGNILDVEVTPGSVMVKCEVTSDSKEVPIRIIPTGTLQEGYAIGRISATRTRTIIYGKAENLESIDEITVQIDVSAMTETQSIKSFNIIRPTGVVKTSVASVDIDIMIEPVLTREMVIPIEIIGNTNNYDIVLPENGDIVTVKITGASSIVNALITNDIKAQIDVTNYKLGSHKASIKITVDDEWLEYELLSPSSITITMEENING